METTPPVTTDATGTTAPTPPYRTRPFRPGTHDMSAIATINALGNAPDELGRYMRRDIQRYWASFRGGNLRFLQAKLLGRGTRCFVAESTTTTNAAAAGAPSPDVVVGAAVWTRHGKGSQAKAWQRENAGWGSVVDRALRKVEDVYYARVPGVDPTLDRAHARNIRPVMEEGWPGDVFEEFWELDALYVHPDHQRRGVGRMLLRWGVERGREEGVCVVVHSSPLGKGLYMSEGFEVWKRMDGFDPWIPEFREAVELKGPEQAVGCWALVLQPEGTDFLQKARRKLEVEKGAGKDKTEGVEAVTPAAAASGT